MQQRPPTTNPSTQLDVKCYYRKESSTAQDKSSRRSILTMVALIGVAVIPAAAPSPAQAFGSGFPGYDVNMDARKRAQDRIKREMQAELDRAAAYRAKLAAEKAAAQGSAAPASSK